MATKKPKVFMGILNCWQTQVNTSSDMTEDELEAAIVFWNLCTQKMYEVKDPPVTANAQLDAENKVFAETNNKLNYNIEVQVMVLNELKKEVWDKKYSEIKNIVISSPEFKKLTSRANL